jgi:hypothetical protein
VIPGLSGRLLSAAFLEDHLQHRFAASPSPDIRRSLFEARAKSDRLGPAASVRTVLEAAAEPLLGALGFDRPAQIVGVSDVLAATVEIGGMRAALLVAGWGQPLEPIWRTAAKQAGARGVRWCFLFNGTHIRIVDGERVYCRRHVELDIDLALENDRALCALLVLLQSGTGLAALVERSEAYGVRVCRFLRDGVLAASAEALAALAGTARSGPLDAAYDEALTVVYRILFLLFAEARDLLPVWHRIYRESYSIDALRAVAESPRPAHGLWDALRAAGRLAHTGCRAGTLQVTPFNGRLFAPSRAPLIERRDLDDESARRMLLALTTSAAPRGQGRERISYRDLGVEQLGAVYETLLDYQPRVDPAPRTPDGRTPLYRVSLEAGSGRRKASGTFYTPQPLAEYLVRRTLKPLVERAAPEEILALKVLDPAMGSGAFLVAACLYLSQAYESSLALWGRCHPSDIGPTEHAAIRRTVAERCLYGVDCNPMAVQLAKLSIWLATLAADRPLTFLDHHLLAGDSVLGAWVASLRRPPTAPTRRGDAGTLALFHEDLAGEALRDALPQRFSLAAGPSDSADQVRDKERTLEALNDPKGAIARWKHLADLWCAQWFAGGSRLQASTYGALADAVVTGAGELPTHVLGPILDHARRLASRLRFFHWELEFPEAFFDGDGARTSSPGFDAVLGNPPWEMLRADTAGCPRGADERDVLRATLRFTRDAGVFHAQSNGHANQYQLFVERAAALTRPRGRLGLVLPYGVFADQGSARLRRLLFSSCDVDAIIGFDNRDAVFPIHRSVRFVLTTATKGRPTRETACRLGERSMAALEGDDADGSWFPVHVTPAVLERMSGDALALPDLRSPIDLAIAERAATLFKPLGDSTGWHARFGRELNTTDDRACLRTGDRGLPVVEGKHIHPFHVDVSTCRWRVLPRDAERLLGTRHLRRRLGYRDVASATNRVTLIAALLPAGCPSTHTVFCLRTPLGRRSQLYLCGLLNSLVVNYLARLRVSAHVTTAIVERLPIPTEEDAGRSFGAIVSTAARLMRRFELGGWARLNATVARLYQLTADELRYLLGTFPLIAEPERACVLERFLKSG